MNMTFSFAYLVNKEKELHNLKGICKYKKVYSCQCCGNQNLSHELPVSTFYSFFFTCESQITASIRSFRRNFKNPYLELFPFFPLKLYVNLSESKRGQNSHTKTINSLAKPFMQTCM